MSDFTTILNHIPAALLVIFRIGGLMMYGPVFGSAVIPGQVKIFLCAMLGIAAYPLIASHQAQGVPLQLDMWTLAPIITMELLIGLIIGFVASLPLLAMQMGGLIMGQQMGLGFAQLYNPALDDEADIVGQMLFFLALAGFLIVGGHEWIMLAILHSFNHVPLGGFAIDVSVIDLATGMLLASFELALRVAAPLLALVFLETVAMGFLSKTVPQLNVISLGFPIRILIGIGVAGMGLVIINDVAMDAMMETFDALARWIETQ